MVDVVSMCFDSNSAVEAGKHLYTIGPSTGFVEIGSSILSNWFTGFVALYNVTPLLLGVVAIMVWIVQMVLTSALHVEQPGKIWWVISFLVTVFIIMPVFSNIVFSLVSQSVCGAGT